MSIERARRFSYPFAGPSNEDVRQAYGQEVLQRLEEWREKNAKDVTQFGTVAYRLTWAEVDSLLTVMATTAPATKEIPDAH